MEQMRFINDGLLWLLWLVPLLVLLFSFSFYRKHILLRRFAQMDLLSHINMNVGFSRQIFKAVLIVMASVFIIVGLTQPGWNPKPKSIERKGRDLLVLLDVSQSMLAEDLKPNRLERAKLDITELIDHLSNDRIGIIAFAGNSVVKCPLTHDYGFAKMALNEISTISVSRGGTLIGDAIRRAVDEVFDNEDKDFKDIILITDGEDHESLPINAAQAAAKKGIRLFVIGVGDETEGTRIPIVQEDGSKTFLKYEGKEVWSKLNAEALKDIALATPGGKYLGVKTGSYDLLEVYRRLIEAGGKRDLEATTIMEYEEKFQIFLGLALTLLLIEVMISERKKVL